MSILHGSNKPISGVAALSGRQLKSSNIPGRKKGRRKNKWKGNERGGKGKGREGKGENDGRQRKEEKEKGKGIGWGSTLGKKEKVRKMK